MYELENEDAAVWVGAAMYGAEEAGTGWEDGSGPWSFPIWYPHTVEETLHLRPVCVDDFVTLPDNGAGMRARKGRGTFVDRRTAWEAEGCSSSFLTGAGVATLRLGEGVARPLGVKVAVLSAEKREHVPRVGRRGVVSLSKARRWREVRRVADFSLALIRAFPLVLAPVSFARSRTLG